jgi:hypothetical protein
MFPYLTIDLFVVFLNEGGCGQLLDKGVLVETRELVSSVSVGPLVVLGGVWVSFEFFVVFQHFVFAFESYVVGHCR